MKLEFILKQNNSSDLNGIIVKHDKSFNAEATQHQNN